MVISCITKIYEKYTESFGLTDFYDKLSKPVMYETCDLWEHKQIDIVTEHICSNVAHS
jgi:MerR family transcriptional regulator, light-induced transcriptional regulator